MLAAVRQMRHDRSLTESQPRNPLHGVTLEMMVTELVSHFGWTELATRIRIRCFSSDPSVSSSLKFLRKTPWAREKVEGLYQFMLRERVRRARQTGSATSGTSAGHRRRSTCTPRKKSVS